MKKGKIVSIVFLSFLSLLLVSAIVFIAVAEGRAKETPEEEKPDIAMYSELFDVEFYEEVPIMEAPNGKVGTSEDYGQENYLIDVNGTTVEDYRTYLQLLEATGFTKYVDNGEQGLDNGAVYTASYTKGDLVVTVAYLTRIEKTYISVSENLPLSDHLIYSESYAAGNKEGAKTTLSLLEQFEVGNSFVIQLKNGHFLVSDGGVAEMLPYLIDYLESLVPAGEKPVIEGWFFTHPHGDHSGVMDGVMDHPEYAERVVVEGVYYNKPGRNAFAKDSAAQTTSQTLVYAAMALRNSQGVKPNVYRMQIGQRYYFSDITVDVVMTQEQILPDNYFADINEASTWCLCTIDGQTVLLTGDADKGSMKAVMRTYSQEYLSVDMMSSLHHSINTWDVFTDYCTVKTILVTRYGMNMNAPYCDPNHYLEQNVDEILSYVDGTKVLTFPYTVGKAKSLPNLTWKYHTEEQIKNRIIVQNVSK